MLSILIPTYNYDCHKLVEELKKQCDLSSILYEIIVLDDASSFLPVNNLKIEQLTNCYLHKNSNNLGRANTINKLFSIAKYNNCLLLDCDVFPKNNQFISNYTSIVKEGYQIAFGGIIYVRKKPNNEEMLRWKYGHKREAIATPIRKKAPYNHLLTSNILISKLLFKEPLFHTDITEYGYEDLVFAQKLKQQKIEIIHFENAVFHLNIEKSTVFLQKTETALMNLFLLEKKGILPLKSTKLSKLYYLLKKMKLLFFCKKTFQLAQNILKKNLISKNPNLVIFDIYKLLFYCNISK